MRVALEPPIPRRDVRVARQRLSTRRPGQQEFCFQHCSRQSSQAGLFVLVEQLMPVSKATKVAGIRQPGDPHVHPVRADAEERSWLVVMAWQCRVHADAALTA